MCVIIEVITDASVTCFSCSEKKPAEQLLKTYGLDHSSLLFQYVYAIKTINVLLSIPRLAMY